MTTYTLYYENPSQDGREPFLLGAYDNFINVIGAVGLDSIERFPDSKTNDMFYLYLYSEWDGDELIRNGRVSDLYCEFMRRPSPDPMIEQIIREQHKHIPGSRG